MKPFLDVYWQDLLLVNYRLRGDAHQLLEKYLPPGTELDDFNGEHYVSVVAFRFHRTRMLGIPAPLYRDFPEINLRFYARRRVGDSWRRGVVFIKEIIPCRIPAMIARSVFKENFHVHKLTREHVSNHLTYQWPQGEVLQEIKTKLTGNVQPPEPGSLDEHIIEHYWAYKRLGTNKSGEFHVSHRPWRIESCPEAEVNLDLKAIYGKELAEAMDDQPVSVFYANGSRVQVTKPRSYNTLTTETKTNEDKHQTYQTVRP